MILEALIEQAQKYTTHAKDVEYKKEGERTYIIEGPKFNTPFAKIYLDGEEIIVKYCAYGKCQSFQVFNLLTTEPTIIAWVISKLIADIAR